MNVVSFCGINPRMASKTYKTDTVVQRALIREMDRARIKPRALSERAGLAHSYLLDVLKGKIRNPSGAKLQQVAEYLRIPASHLYTDHPPADDAPPPLGASQPETGYSARREGSALRQSDPLLADLAEAIDLIRATPGDADANDRLVELAVKHAARQSQRQGGAVLSTAQQHALLVQVFELLQRARSDPAFLLASANPAPPPPAAPHQSGASAAGRSRAKR